MFPLLFSLMLAPARAERPLRVAPALVHGGQALNSKGLVADLNGRRVYVKITGWGSKPCAETLTEARYAQLISPTGIGPRYHGRLDTPIPFINVRPRLKRYGLIFDYVEGHVMRGVLGVDDDDIPTDFLPEVEIEGEVVLRPHTLTQVVHAFDVLADLRIEASDIQFIITPEGNAKLIDYGTYGRARSARAAREFMREEREALIEGLRRRITN